MLIGLVAGLVVLLALASKPIEGARSALMRGSDPLCSNGLVQEQCCSIEPKLGGEGENFIDNVLECIKGILQNVRELKISVPPACCKLPLFDIVCKIFEKPGGKRLDSRQPQIVPY